MFGVARTAAIAVPSRAIWLRVPASSGDDQACGNAEAEKQHAVLVLEAETEERASVIQWRGSFVRSNRANTNSTAAHTVRVHVHRHD